LATHNEGCGTKNGEKVLIENDSEKLRDKERLRGANITGLPFSISSSSLRDDASHFADTSIPCFPTSCASSTVGSRG